MPTLDASGHDGDVVAADPLENVLKILEESKRNSGRSSTVVIVAAILALPLGMLVGPFGPLLWLFSAAVLMQLVLTTIHELGHLAVAWIAGFHIEHFVVGPFAVVRNGRSFRLAHNRMTGIGGYVSSVPNSSDTPTGWLIAYLAAGSVANLFTAAVIVVAYLLSPRTPLITAIMFPVAFCAITTAVIGLVPMRKGGLSTDGRMILDLSQEGPERTRLLATWQLSALTRQKQRPRDWETFELEPMLCSTNGSQIDTGGWYLSYLHHLDAGRDSDAARNIERSIASLGRLPISLTTAHFVEATYFYVLRGSSPSLARDVLTRTSMAFVDDASRLRAEAAVLLAEGQTHLAVEKAQRAIVLADATPDLGIANFERDLAQRLIDTAEANAPLPSTKSRSVAAYNDYIAVSPTT